MEFETEAKVEIPAQEPVCDVRKKKTSNNRKLCDALYLFVVILIFISLFVSMVFYPRSTVSERENRKLASFPSFSISSLLNGSFTSGINVYFSDTVPGRDELTADAVAFKDKSGFRVGGVKLHNAKPASQPEPEVTEEEEGNKEIKEAKTNVNLEDNATLGNNGILVVGTRGLMLFGGNKSVGKKYAEVVNEYKKELGKDVNVYCVPVPTAIEFYCPPSYKKHTNSELESINNIIESLDDSVKGVDVYTTLSEHSDEDIYLRTDHHWAALGAYYAAESFAKAAKVDFPKLSEYEKVVKKDFVGTLYNFSNDIVLKENPEDFVYYKPKGVKYTTDYYPVDNMNKPTRGEFFFEYEDGSPLLYGTFMGGDNHITHVHTDVDNDRRLVIFKDSYGNAFSSFMINSFEDVYVIDMRYFKYNALEFMEEYEITDVAFVNNVFHADTQSSVNYYKNFLTQESPVTEKKDTKKEDSAKETDDEDESDEDVDNSKSTDKKSNTKKGDTAKTNTKNNSSKHKKSVADKN